MTRAERLLALLQALRRRRMAVRGEVLAQELGISLRTLYRDIAILREQGAHIEGEPGIGYVLKPGFLLPPLMFTEEEIEALVLGGRWVAEHGDERLGAAAREAVEKIAAPCWRNGAPPRAFQSARPGRRLLTGIDRGPTYTDPIVNHRRSQYAHPDLHHPLRRFARSQRPPVCRPARCAAGRSLADLPA